MITYGSLGALQSTMLNILQDNHFQTFIIRTSTHLIQSIRTKRFQGTIYAKHTYHTLVKAAIHRSTKHFYLVSFIAFGPKTQLLIISRRTSATSAREYPPQGLSPQGYHLGKATAAPRSSVHHISHHGQHQGLDSCSRGHPPP